MQPEDLDCRITGPLQPPYANGLSCLNGNVNSDEEFSLLPDWMKTRENYITTQS